MKIKHIICFVTILLFCSCGKNKDVNTNEQIFLDMNNAEQFIEFNALFDTTECELIKLSDTKIPIAVLSKIQMVDDLMYISDYQTKCIHVFSADGQAKNTIQRLGKSSTEYLDITDFYVTNKNIFVLDQNSSKILVLNTDGTYSKNISISTLWGNNMIVQGERIYLSNNNSETELGNYRLFAIDMDGNLINKYLRFTERYKMNTDFPFSVLPDEGAFYCNSPINTIYSINDGKVEPVAELDFGSYNLPSKYYSSDLREFLQYKLEDKYIQGIEDFYVTSNYIILKYKLDRKDYTAIYNRLSHKVEKICRGIIVKNRYHIGLSNYQIHGNYIYDQYSAIDFLTLYREIIQENATIGENYKSEIRDVVNGLSNESNPIIVKYKIAE